MSTLAEKQDLIVALEEALNSATDAIDESGQEIVRLQGLVRGLELTLHNSHRPMSSQVKVHPVPMDGIARSESTFDEKDSHPPLVERTNVGGRRTGSTISLGYHSLEGAAIVEENDSGDDDQVTGVVKDMQDRMMIIEFESTHLKEKLDKVLHTVDCLNDDIAGLEKDNREKECTIETLLRERDYAIEQLKAAHPEAGYVPNTATSRTTTPTGEALKQRVWGSGNRGSITPRGDGEPVNERRKSAGSESSFRSRSNSRSLTKQPSVQKKKILL